ncbi:MAG: HNH endonuclease [Anaerolineae bacterium]|nr:HNH endonuclease [Anaerolineae bacterium]
MNAIPLKRCSKCGTEYPATTEFFPLRTDTGKLRAQCRPCCSARRHRHYENNREHILEQSRRWKQENKERRAKTHRAWYDANRETILAKGRQGYHENREYNARRARRYHESHREQRSKARREYYENNRERTLSQNRQWYQNNKEKRLAKSRLWRQANPERARALCRVSQHVRRARKRNAAGTHTADDIQRQYEAQHGRCWWCNCDLNGVYHADHLIPLSRGGGDAPENIVIACSSCNSSKGSKLPHEWCGRLF